MIACTPHPGLGTVSVQRGARVTVVDLATCRERAAPRRVVVPTLTTRRTGSTESLVYRGRIVYSVHERFGKDTPQGLPGPIEPVGLSPDRRWALFAVDPQGSASLAADGLTLQVVSTRGGRAHTIASGLLAPDYRAWCGGKLVMTAGGDRIAAHHKWLVVATPPNWQVRRLLEAPTWSFGALACARDGIVVQAVRDSTTAMFPRWQLWRIGLAGATSVVDRPPPGRADDSPRVSRDGTLYFVRSSRGHGRLYALRGGRVVGPLLSLGYSPGYYGARDWPYAPR